MAVEIPKVLKMGVGASLIRPLFENAKVLHGDAVVKAEDAAAVLVQAQAQSEAWIQEAHAEADAIRGTAAAEGKAQGYREVIEELAVVRGERRLLHDAARDDLIELAFKVAQEVVKREVDRDPQIILETVERALEHARGRRQIVVRIHPSDTTTVEFSRSLLETIVQGTQIHFETDESVQPGGCIIDTEGGQIQADLALQLQALKRSLLEEP